MLSAAFITGFPYPHRRYAFPVDYHYDTRILNRFLRELTPDIDDVFRGHPQPRPLQAGDGGICEDHDDGLRICVEEWVSSLQLL